MIKQLQKSKEEFDKKFPQKLIRKSINWGVEDDPRKDILDWHEEQQLALIQEIKVWAKENKTIYNTKTGKKEYINPKDLLKELDNIKK